MEAVITAIQISEETIKKGNLEINKYLGKEITHKEYAPTIANLNGSYHKDWNWLMDVVERINQNDMQCEGAIRDLKYTITYLLGGYYGFTDYKRLAVTFTRENLWARVVVYCQYKNNGGYPVTIEDAIIN